MRFLALIAGGVVGYVLGGAVASAETAAFPLPEAGPSAPAAATPPTSAPKPIPIPAITIPAVATAPPKVAPQPESKQADVNRADSKSETKVEPLTTPAGASLAVEPAPAPIPIAPAAAPAAKKKLPPPPPLETALSTDPQPSYQPDTYAVTLRVAERYADIVKTGGWPTDIVAGHPHSMGPEVAELRKRLSIEGDLPASEPTDGPAAEIWDDGLTEAVKRFQKRMGLRPTGIVAGQTLKEIDVPAEARAASLAASAERMNSFTFSFGDRYVFVNLPSTSVEAVENGQIAHRYVAIVGNVDHPSPQIAAHISEVNLNPTWTLPVSIIKKEIIPRMKRDPGYLTRQKIRILDASGQQIDPKSIDWSTNRATNYTLRQDSGAGNSLGSIRIDMPNKLAVYMHDTPGKRLFGADYRFLSHGCVRVQGVYDYAEWLLQGTPKDANGVWDKAAMTAKVKDGARLDIRLTKSVPVIWLYLTGWANNDGVAHFRDDVYGLDNPAVAKEPGDVASVSRAARRSACPGAMTASRPLANRVDPFGELHAVASRGALMGNRGGRFHRDDQSLGARRWTNRQWIACACEFKGRQRDVWGRYYTELFFLDELTALAAGHRPCFECRRADANRFRDALGEGGLGAEEMDRRLHNERLDGKTKRLHRLEISGLPNGAFLVREGGAFAVRDDALLPWSFDGYGPPVRRPRAGAVDVLTPPTILRALAAGYATRA